MSFPTKPDCDWISSQKVIAQSGDPSKKSGLAYLIYEASRDMAPNTVFFSSDGDYLIVPQAGTLDIQTELGNLLVRQNEIAVIPRGIRYRVNIPSGTSRGYICELYQGHFKLPELGPIGSCSLANVRDFQIPVAHFDGAFENGVATCTPSRWTVITKFAGRLYTCTQNHTPFDVAAWHGTYYPFKYDLARFSLVGSILYDHPDPSIFTVLTAPSHREPGHSVIDFAIIPPRWLVMEDTYWPPYFHRNTMAEFSGPIINDQNPESPWNQGEAFVPFGAQLNNAMVPHGPDKRSHEEARTRALKPEKVGMDGFTIFLFESEAMIGVTDWAMEAAGKLGKGKANL
jgi:homogentisate 1,2-dioxygenase